MSKAPLPRKLLIASLGVASVSYVACNNLSSGNLMAPPCDEAHPCPDNAGGGGQEQVGDGSVNEDGSGGLGDVSLKESGAAGGAGGKAEAGLMIVGNLMPPPPCDAGGPCMVDSGLEASPDAADATQDH